jgi:predicted ATP-grasp superfamily ATP-dependent carboligase
VPADTRGLTVGFPPVDRTTPAVVLKFDPNAMHHGGLGAIRSLGRLGIPVYGVHEGPWAPAANSRYLHGRLFWQPAPEDAERVCAGLLQLARRIGRPAVLIPTDDAGAIFLAEHGGGLRDAFLFPRPPVDLPRKLAGKYSMHLLCRELGMPSPRVTLPASLDEALEFSTAEGFPVLAKLTTPWRYGGTLRSTTIVRTAAELEASYHESDRAGARLILQEHIPGGPGRDWIFHGYCGTGPACRPAFTGIKDRSYPAYAGLTSLGHSAPNPALRDQVSAMLARLSYRGIMDLDLRYDARDGQHKLLDFNPRLGAQFRLFRDAAGIDVVRAAYLDLTGQAVPAAAQVDGRSFVVENYDPLGALGYWRRGDLSLRAWARSLHGVDEVAWFAGDDLRPFGLMCLRMGWRAASRPLTGRRGAVAGRAARPRYRGGRAAARPGPDGSPWTAATATRPRRATPGAEAISRPGAQGPHERTSTLDRGDNA